MTKEKITEKKHGFLMTFILKVPWLLREETITLHAGALAFFALFSFLPILFLTYLLFDKLSKGVATEFLFTTQETMGHNAANLLIKISEQLRTFQDHWTVYALGLIIVLYAGTRFVFFLKKSMNHIWRVPTPKKWIIQEIKHRAISVLSIFLLAFLATIVTLQKAAFITIRKFLGPNITIIVYYFALTIAIYSVIAAIYKIIPDANVQWGDVIIGSAFTTIIFWVGFFIIKAVIKKSLVSTIYGAISGILLILLWTYYFAQIIYIGAEITKVYATHYGSMKDQKEKLIKKHLIN